MTPDPLDGLPSGPTSVYKTRTGPEPLDPELVAAVEADSPGALGAGAVLLLAVLALDVWRALQQSITHDEALAFARRAAVSWSLDPHPVHALLAQASVALLGVQEWTLRLPSLLGAALFLMAGLGLCRLAFGRGWLAFVGFALLALNPLLLDLQSLGRGDGLSLGLMLWGALHLLLLLRGTASGSSASFGPVHAIAGSLLLGLAAASCPSTAPAALSLLLAAAFAVALQRSQLPGGVSTRGRARLVLAALLLIGPLLACTLLWLPASQAGWDILGGAAGGSGEVRDTGAALIDASLAHQAIAQPISPAGPFYEPVRDGLLVVFGPLLLGALAARLIFIARRWRGLESVAQLDRFERSHVLLGGALLLASATWALLSLALARPWPDARAATSLLVLALLCATGLAAEGWRRGGLARLGALTPLAGLLALLVQFGSQVQASEYLLWRHDAGARRVFEQLVRRQDKSPRVSVRVAADAELAPALDFYRLQRRAGWMQPVRAGVDVAKPEADFLVVVGATDRVKIAGFSPLPSDAAGVVAMEASRD